jgi:uncharacterized protein (TIGR03083 family)
MASLASLPHVLSPLPLTDTRALFRPVSSELVTLLRRLPADAWHRPTIAGSWVVRDVVAHLIDLTFRRLSFHRDRMPPPPPRNPINSEQDFVDFINGLNRDFVEAMRRLSPHVLTDLFEKGSTELADFFEQLPLDAPALFPVSWAGEDSSEGWFDIGREFTELWHHQAQVRLAVGALSLAAPRYLRAMLEIALRGLPHAFRHLETEQGSAVVIAVHGPAGGMWTLVREANRWVLLTGCPGKANASVRVSDENAWRLLFNALTPSQALAAIEIEGDATLTRPLFSARSVIV